MLPACFLSFEVSSNELNSVWGYGQRWDESVRGTMKRGGFSLANRLVVNHGKSVHMFPMFPCSYVDLSCVQFGFHQAKVKSAREVSSKGAVLLSDSIWFYPFDFFGPFGLSMLWDTVIAWEAAHSTLAVWVHQLWAGAGKMHRGRGDHCENMKGPDRWCTSFGISKHIGTSKNNQIWSQFSRQTHGIRAMTSTICSRWEQNLLHLLQVPEGNALPQVESCAMAAMLCFNCSHPTWSEHPRLSLSCRSMYKL